MGQDVYQPFDQDVVRSGGYQYTKTDRRSSIYANNRYSDVIVSSVPMDGKSVVDVGCGDGTYTAMLRTRTRATSILGVDPAAAAIEVANRNYSGRQGLRFQPRVHCRPALRSGEHFDVAIYRGVIHHVADPRSECAGGPAACGYGLFPGT